MQSWTNKKAKESSEAKQSNAERQRAKLEGALHPRRNGTTTRLSAPVRTPPWQGCSKCKGGMMHRGMGGGALRGPAWEEEVECQRQWEPGVGGQSHGRSLPPAETTGAGGPGPRQQRPGSGGAGGMLGHPSPLALRSPTSPSTGYIQPEPTSRQGAPRACHRFHPLRKKGERVWGEEPCRATPGAGTDELGFG